MCPVLGGTVAKTSLTLLGKFRFGLTILSLVHFEASLSPTNQYRILMTLYLKCIPIRSTVRCPTVRTHCAYRKCVPNYSGNENCRIVQECTFIMLKSFQLHKKLMNLIRLSESRCFWDKFHIFFANNFSILVQRWPVDKRNTHLHT